jgi:hypothetical protein|tara:strand:+ start:1783 stop:2112 length:330 start_codon:yes stop_codon:yes gene_type:complete
MENQTEEKQESKWRSRELGALWVRSGKNQKYLSGSINVETMPGVTEQLKVVVFTNKGRDKNEKAPDYVIYRSEDQAQQDVDKVAQAAAEEVKSSQPSVSNNEDIPEELF